MAEYQNLFTQVQLRGPAYAGVPLERGPWTRQGAGRFSYFLGKIGDAQIGPICASPILPGQYEKPPFPTRFQLPV